MSTPATPRARTSQVTKAAKAGQGNRNVWVIAAVVAVIIFAAIIAVALSQESDNGDTGEQTADVTVTGDPLPSAQDLAAATGMAAPVLSGTDLDGEAITIGDDGEPKVIGFFAHWCPHCQAEIPRVVDWIDEGNLPDDVAFYGVSTSVSPAQGNYPPSAWFEDEAWPIPTMLDDADSSAYVSYGAGGFPFWVAVDADGNVVARTTGELTTEQLESLVDQARA